MTEKIASLLARYAIPLFFLYVAGAMAPLFLFRAEFNAPYNFSFRYLLVPITGLSAYLGYVHRAIFLRGRPPTMPYWLQVILVGPMLTLFAGGYVLAANALLPPQRVVDLQGAVHEKFVSGTKMTSYVIVLDTPEGLRQLEVSATEFEFARVGASYSTRWRVGPLGFIYRKRHEGY